MSLRMWRKNRQLRARRRKLDKEGKRSFNESKKKKNNEIYEEWWGLNQWEFDSIDAQIKNNDTRDLLDRAERLHLPTPAYGDKDKWLSPDDLSSPPGERVQVLTPEAWTEIEDAIHKKERDRREVWEWRIKIVGGIITPTIALLTGLVGSIIGLRAIWHK